MCYRLFDFIYIKKMIYSMVFAKRYNFIFLTTLVTNKIFKVLRVYITYVLQAPLT